MKFACILKFHSIHPPYSTKKDISFLSCYDVRFHINCFPVDHQIFSSSFTPLSCSWVKNHIIYIFIFIFSVLFSSSIIHVSSFTTHIIIFYNRACSQKWWNIKIVKFPSFMNLFYNTNYNTCVYTYLLIYSL